MHGGATTGDVLDGAGDRVVGDVSATEVVCSRTTSHCQFVQQLAFETITR